LEDVLEKIRQQFKRFKGGPLLILAAGVVVMVLWTAWFTVQPEETGIVQRFGKVMRTAGPGLHFKLPYGIEKVRLLPTARVLKEEFGFRTVSTVPGEKTRYDTRGAYKDESLMLTGDLNVIDVQWIIQYRIEDPIRYLFQVRDTSKTIRDTTEAVMRRAVGNRLGSDVLTTGRVAVASEAKTEIQKILTAYESGVRLVTVELQDVTPPDTVKPAFNEVNESRQDKERTINKAQEQANREIPKARGRGHAKHQRGRGLRTGTHQPGRRRGHTLRSHSRAVPTSAAGHAPAAVPGGYDRFPVRHERALYRGPGPEGHGALASN
jgi:membrane protease subunit HflK